VLSRNKFLSIKQISLAGQQELMIKLNKWKIRWVVREGEKRDMGFYTIAKAQRISPRWAREVCSKYKGVKDPVLLSCGRKHKPVTFEERQLVKSLWEEYPVGACMMQAILEEKGIRMSHNRIHRIMLEEGLAKEELKKQRRRRWIRYERKNSLSLKHADWFEYKRRKCLIFIDDASRFITGYGEFDQATTENTIKVFKQSLKHGKPRQVHTDHGSQFVANEQEGKKIGTSEFTQYLNSLGIQHIKARIKHPQANGKAERAIATIKQLWKHFGNLNKTIEYYNYKRPHMSLTNGKLRTPYQAFLDKMRK